MRAHRPSWAGCRAAIAVVALYALVLQALLGNAAAAREPVPGQAICLTDDGAGTDAPGPDAHHGAHHGMSCCTPAPCVAPFVPSDASAIVAWPVHHAVALRWRDRIVAQPRAPPRTLAQPRAPPAA